MKILAIDTSSKYASCAVLIGNSIVSEKVLATGLVHSKSLMPLVEDCLNSANLSLSEIDRIACVTGPGSFTGVRIGVCAVKGLAFAHSIPCVPVNTLHCLKENVPYFNGFVCPIMDARRGQVYCAVYKDGVAVKECDACSIDNLLAFVKREKTLFLGDGQEVFKQKITETLGENAFFAPAHLNFTRSSSAAVCALNLPCVSCDGLDAFYLRKPQAEREYESKHPSA